MLTIYIAYIYITKYKYRHISTYYSSHVLIEFHQSLVHRNAFSYSVKPQAIINIYCTTIWFLDTPKSIMFNDIRPS